MMINVFISWSFVLIQTRNFRFFLSPEVYENKCQVFYSYEWNCSVKLAE